jgi:hypothetical protein
MYGNGKWTYTYLKQPRYQLCTFVRARPCKAFRGCLSVVGCVRPSTISSTGGPAAANVVLCPLWYATTPTKDWCYSRQIWEKRGGDSVHESSVCSHDICVRFSARKIVDAVSFWDICDKLCAIHCLASKFDIYVLLQHTLWSVVCSVIGVFRSIAQQCNCAIDGIFTKTCANEITETST